MAPDAGRVVILHVSYQLLQHTPLTQNFHYSEGTGRMTIFASESNAQTFDYEVSVEGLEFLLLNSLMLWFTHSPGMLDTCPLHMVRVFRSRFHCYDHELIVHALLRPLRRERWKHYSALLGDIQDRYDAPYFYKKKQYADTVHSIDRFQDVSLAQVSSRTNITILA